jgi:GNAT superfamily N-acetyltransferase
MVAMQMSTEQRLMGVEDTAAAFELSSAAGWNQTPEDWQMLRDLAPDGCFALEADGRLVSTTTLLCYQQRLAWIGMVLTKPEYRSRGFARQLLASALERADSLEVETIKLDATDQGRPLYETFEFQAEQPVERWFRPGSSKSISGLQHPLLPKHLLDCDSEAFGADRSAVLQRLLPRSSVYADANAYLLARPGRTTEYLGPCVASDPVAARKIINSIIHDSTHTSWSWDLLPGNRYAVALASELGFTPQRSLTRMTRGKPLRGRDDMVYAIAGFELG